METIPILTSAGIFGGLTLFYGLVKYFMASSSYPNNDTISNVIYGFYVVIAIFIQLTININNSKALCDGKSPQIMGTMFHTFLPNLLIFIVVGICIRMFPGWLQPFSNTVGYCFLAVFKNLKWLGDLPTQGDDCALIKKDNSLFLNELTPTNFTSVVTKMLKANLIDFEDKKSEDLGENNGAPITKSNSGYKPMVGGKRRRKRKQKGGGQWDEDDQDAQYTSTGKTYDQSVAEAEARNAAKFAREGFTGYDDPRAVEARAAARREQSASWRDGPSAPSAPSAPPMSKQNAQEQKQREAMEHLQQIRHRQPITQPTASISSAQATPIATPIATPVHTQKGKNKSAGAKEEEKLSKEIKANLDKIKFQNLWKLVNIKSVISEVIWFLLCGVLVLAYSYNAILNLSCSHSLEQQEILQKEGDEKLEKLMKEIDDS